MNSYLRPKMRVYLDGMRSKLEQDKLQTPMHIVRSDGGVMSLNAAAEHPVNTLLSGPSGGAVASAYIGRLADSRTFSLSTWVAPQLMWPSLETD